MDIFDNMGWLLNFIPLWVYVVAAIVALALTVQFWGPIFAVMPNWMKTVFGVLAALFAALVYGKYSGAKLERQKQAEREANAVRKRQEINRRVDVQSKTETQKELSRWNRRDE